jgi:hypothetical protein
MVMWTLPILTGRLAFRRERGSGFDAPPGFDGVQLIGPCFGLATPFAIWAMILLQHPVAVAGSGPSVFFTKKTCFAHKLLSSIG